MNNFLGGRKWQMMERRNERMNMNDRWIVRGRGARRKKFMMKGAGEQVVEIRGWGPPQIIRCFMAFPPFCLLFTNIIYLPHFYTSCLASLRFAFAFEFAFAVRITSWLGLAGLVFVFGSDMAMGDLGWFGVAGFIRGVSFFPVSYL